MWIGEEECYRIIEHAWRTGCGRGTIQDVMAIIERCNQDLNKWNKNTFGNVHKHLAEAKQILQYVQSMDQCMARNNELKEA